MLKRYRGPAPLQMPDRSGLPSAVRGAGATRLGVPSARRGVPGVGYLSHWAAAVVGSSDAERARAAALNRPVDLMDPPSAPTIISTRRPVAVVFENLDAAQSPTAFLLGRRKDR